MSQPKDSVRLGEVYLVGYLPNPSPSTPTHSQKQGEATPCKPVPFASKAGPLFIWVSFCPHSIGGLFLCLPVALPVGVELILQIPVSDLKVLPLILVIIHVSFPVPVQVGQWHGQLLKEETKKAICDESWEWQEGFLVSSYSLLPLELPPNSKSIQISYNSKQPLKKYFWTPVQKQVEQMISSYSLCDS